MFHQNRYDVWVFMVGYEWLPVIKHVGGRNIHQKKQLHGCYLFRLANTAHIMPPAMIVLGVHFIHLCNPTEDIVDCTVDDTAGFLAQELVVWRMPEQSKKMGRKEITSTVSF